MKACNIVIAVALLVTSCTSINEIEYTTLTEKNILEKLPSGMQYRHLLEAYNKVKSGGGGTAIAISKKFPGGYFAAWSYGTDSIAKSEALKRCNHRYGYCSLYSVGNKIVFDAEEWRKSWKT